MSRIAPNDRAGWSGRGFTLIEMLVVIVIIGILAALGAPTVKGIKQANLVAAANRQLLDDLSYARTRALSDRTTVYMVFVPTNIVNVLKSPLLRPDERRIVTNLVLNQYSTYALLTLRTVGDQPGQHAPRYLTEWRSLPKGILIPDVKFSGAVPQAVVPGDGRYGPAVQQAFGRVFDRRTGLPFPKAHGQVTNIALPYIAFSPEGQLITQHDELIPLVHGTITVQHDNTGAFQARGAVANYVPKVLTATNDFQVVRVNWVTGRAKVEANSFLQ